MKKSLLRSLVRHEISTPVNITTPVSRTIGAEIPSTPRLRPMPSSPSGPASGSSSQSQTRMNWNPPALGSYCWKT